MKIQRGSDPVRFAAGQKDGRQKTPACQNDEVLTGGRKVQKQEWMKFSIVALCEIAMCSRSFSHAVSVLPSSTASMIPMCSRLLAR